MKTNLLTLLALISLLPAARAQVGAVQQVDNAQQQRQIQQTAKAAYQAGDTVAEGYAGESSDTGEQIVLAHKARPLVVEFSADVQFLRTDNMFLSEHAKQAADMLVSTAELAVTPRALKLGGGEFTARHGYRHQWYDYGLWGAKLDGFNTKLSTYDFNVQTAFSDLKWARDGWTVGAGFDFNRLMNTAAYNEFYREYVPHWGLQKTIPLTATSSLTVGYEGDYRFSDLYNTGIYTPDGELPEHYNNRTDHGILVSYSQMLGQHALVQPYYRFKYTDFTAESVHREDYLNSFGVAVYWFFSPRFSARAVASYDLRHSSATTIPDYQKLDLGLGLNFTYRF